MQILGADNETLPRYTPIFGRDFKEQIFSPIYEGGSMTEGGLIEARELAYSG